MRRLVLGLIVLVGLVFAVFGGGQVQVNVTIAPPVATVAHAADEGKPSFIIEDSAPGWKIIFATAYDPPEVRNTSDRFNLGLKELARQGYTIGEIVPIVTKAGYVYGSSTEAVFVKVSK